MMRSSNLVSYRSQQDGRAAVFVDYENLYELLGTRLSNRSHPDEYIAEILDRLRGLLQERDGTRTLLQRAFADFCELQGNGLFVQRALLQQGIDLRHTASAAQRNAAEVQLSIDVMELLHQRPDIDTVVLVTGDRPYVPLVQQIRRYGRDVLVLCADVPNSLESLPEREVFLDAFDLLDNRAPARLPSPVLNGTRGPVNGNGAATSPPRTTPYQRLSDAVTFQTLEIIEEHFGQYDEVYLTPLLRKLSELLDEQTCDPKTIISDLEAAGAVWLEKRRGYPYDYTVLLVDVEHPDVAEVQKAFYTQRDTGDSYGDAYFEDEPEEHDGSFVDDNDTYREDDWDEQHS
jgi:hypothetical protein